MTPGSGIAKVSCRFCYVAVRCLCKRFPQYVTPFSYDYSTASSKRTRLAQSFFLP